MKRYILFSLALLLALGLQAQTNFRKISYQEALKAAQTEKKQVFIDFFTTWCGPCKRMSREVFPSQEVGNFMNEHFVALQIDAEKGEGVELAKKYKVTAFPTFVVLDAQEKELGRIVGFYQSSDFIANLDRLVTPDMSPERIKARYAAGERNGKLIQAYASLVMDECRNQRNLSMDQYQAKQAEVKKLVQDYFQTLGEKERFDKENHFIYTSYTDLPDDPAAKFLIENRTKFANQKEADSLINRYYWYEGYKYLAGQKDYDAVRTPQWEKEVEQLKLNKDKSYTPMFAIINAMPKGLDAWLSAFSKNLKSLDITTQAGAISGVCEKNAGADDATKKKASRAVREQLPDMPFQLLYTAVIELNYIEGASH